ncbi:MAG: hypothetical protein AAFR61_27130 [Bacteroidota bacterium]
MSKRYFSRLPLSIDTHQSLSQKQRWLGSLGAGLVLCAFLLYQDLSKPQLGAASCQIEAEASLAQAGEQLRFTYEFTAQLSGYPADSLLTVVVTLDEATGARFVPHSFEGNKGNWQGVEQALVGRDSRLLIRGIPQGTAHHMGFSVAVQLPTQLTEPEVYIQPQLAFDLGEQGFFSLTPDKLTGVHVLPIPLVYELQRYENGYEELTLRNPEGGLAYEKEHALDLEIKALTDGWEPTTFRVLSDAAPQDIQVSETNWIIRGLAILPGESISIQYKRNPLRLTETDETIIETVIPNLDWEFTDTLSAALQPISFTSHHFLSRQGVVYLTGNLQAEKGLLGYQIEQARTQGQFQTIDFIRPDQAASLPWTSGPVQPGNYRFRLTALMEGGEKIHGPVQALRHQTREKLSWQVQRQTEERALKMAIWKREHVRVYFADEAGQSLFSLYDGDMQANLPYQLLWHTRQIPVLAKALRIEGNSFAKTISIAQL